MESSAVNLDRGSCETRSVCTRGSPSCGRELLGEASTPACLVGCALRVRCGIALWNLLWQPSLWDSSLSADAEILLVIVFGDRNNSEPIAAGKCRKERLVMRLLIRQVIRIPPVEKQSGNSAERSHGEHSYFWIFTVLVWKIRKFISYV